MPDVAGSFHASLQRFDTFGFRVIPLEVQTRKSKSSKDPACAAARGLWAIDSVRYRTMPIWSSGLAVRSAPSASSAHGKLHLLGQDVKFHCCWPYRNAV